MASECFVEKKEGRSKGALSARSGGLLEVSIGEKKQQDLVLKEGKRVVRERVGRRGEGGVASVKGKSLSWKA